MISDKSIGEEFGLTEEQTAAILYENPAWALRLGLENFSSNDPMANFIREKIAASLQEQRS